MTGNDLRVRRENLGMTQEELARKLEVSLSTFARWEQLKASEIPNSRLLHLALLALEVLNFHVLEYSHKQGAYHTHSVGEMIQTNIQMILGTDKSNDFLPIGISPSLEELKLIEDTFALRLSEFTKSRKEARQNDLLKEIRDQKQKNRN